MGRSYIPEFVWSFTGWDENGQPTHGLVEWPEHLRPREVDKAVPAPIERDPLMVAMAKADGVSFIVIDKKDRKSIEDSIERLIAMLDQSDGDIDLESTADEEASLGWPERGPCQLGCPSRFGLPGALNDDRELDTCDDEDGADAEPEETDQDSDSEPSLGWSNPCGARVGEELPVFYPADSDCDPKHDCLGYDGSGERIAKELLKRAGKRKTPDSPAIVGERVHILPDGNVLRTYVRDGSGYVLTPQPGQKRGLSGDDFDRLPWG